MHAVCFRTARLTISVSDDKNTKKGGRKMKRLFLISAVLVLSLVLATSALADAHEARVRVVHASPDAPAVDVWVNGSVAFSNAPFKGITDYAKLEPGTYNIQVTPTGATEPVVIEADLALETMTDYTVVAVNTLENIEPLVLIDNNSAPAAGKAHVRFVHASPDAPAVDIAVANGGPVLFSNIPFKGVGDYLPVDAGTYDLEARVAGTETVALSVPGVALADGAVYTIFAMGLVEGEPALTAVPSMDASYPVATTLPETGGETTNLWLMVILGAGLALVAGALVLRSRKDEVA
jgi:LPXTG-motif cell wall-anchored protein